MSGDGLRVLDGATVLKIRGYTGGTKGMAANPFDADPSSATAAL